jgi:hypothetical protein
MMKMRLKHIKDYSIKVRKMNRSNSTNFKSILVLFDLLKNVKQKDVQYLKQLYSKNAEDFESCIDLFSSLNLINIESGLIESVSTLNNFLLRQPNEIEIKEFILNKLLNNANTYVWEYLEKFSISEDKIVFQPQISENLHFSNLRNLLIELDFVSYNPSERFYEISDKYLSLFYNQAIKNKITPEMLKLIILEREKIGKYAEEEVLKYEKIRLSLHKNLVSKIEHISLADTTAGYDIKSFTVNNNIISERFIEVKAISPIEKKFYMSKNEVEKSKKYGKSYYLYLLPVIGKNKFDLYNLTVIENPSSEIFDSDEWCVSCEHFAIEQVKAF